MPCSSDEAEEEHVDLMDALSVRRRDGNFRLTTAKREVIPFVSIVLRRMMETIL